MNQNSGLVEGSYNKKTMLANQEQQERLRQQQKVRKSHMSSYGGISGTDGSRNAVVHDTIQTRETRPVDMRVAKTRSNAPAHSFPDKDAKAKAMAEAMKKVEKDAALKEMRRERAKAVMRAKDEEGKEAARAANRAAAKSRNVEVIAEIIDQEAMVRSVRREQAQSIRMAKEEEKKQQALRRLQSKGLNPSTNRSIGTLEAAPESHTELRSDEDVEIQRLERQLVSLRYQPEAKQYGVKKQLAVLKASKLRKERASRVHGEGEGIWHEAVVVLVATDHQSIVKTPDHQVLGAEALLLALAKATEKSPKTCLHRTPTKVSRGATKESRSTKLATLHSYKDTRHGPIQTSSVIWLKLSL